MIDLPLQNPVVAEFPDGFEGAVSRRDGIAGTGAGAFLTGVAEGGHPEADGDVHLQGQIGDDLGDSAPGAEAGMDQLGVATQLPQAGVDGQGDVQGRTIGAGDGAIPQTPDELGQGDGCQGNLGIGPERRRHLGQGRGLGDPLIVHLMDEDDGIFHSCGDYLGTVLEHARFRMMLETRLIAEMDRIGFPGLRVVVMGIDPAAVQAADPHVIGPEQGGHFFDHPCGDLRLALVFRQSFDCLAADGRLGDTPPGGASRVGDVDHEPCGVGIGGRRHLIGPIQPGESGKAPFQLILPGAPQVGTGEAGEGGVPFPLVDQVPLLVETPVIVPNRIANRGSRLFFCPQRFHRASLSRLFERRRTILRQSLDSFVEA